MNPLGMTILVVDDEKFNVLLLEAILERQGYKILTAEDGLAARDIARQALPDLILLDIMMPKEDGFTACQKLKGDPLTADIPIVFISAIDDEESKAKGFALGAWDYILKPFQVEDISSKAKSYTKLRHAYLETVEKTAEVVSQPLEKTKSIAIHHSDLNGIRFGVTPIVASPTSLCFYDAFTVASGGGCFLVASIVVDTLADSTVTPSAIKALLRQNLSRFTSPDKAMQFINKVLTSFFQGSHCVTLSFVMFDKRSTAATLLRAAGLPVMCLSGDGEIRWLEPKGDKIGVYEKCSFESYTFAMAKQERIFLLCRKMTDFFDNVTVEINRETKELLAKFALHTRQMPIQDATEVIVHEMQGSGLGYDADVVLLGIESIE